MSLRLPMLAMAAAALGGGCGRADTPMPPVAHDPASYANVSAFVARHLVLDITANFDTRTISGTSALAFDRRGPAATEVVLDTRDLTIRRGDSAIGDSPWVETTFKLDAATPA